MTAGVTLVRLAVISALLSSGCTALVSCRRASKSHPAPATSSLSPAASAGVALPASSARVVCLEPELFAPEKRHPTGVFAIEGALVVVEDVRVGRIRGAGIEWIGSVPKRMSPEMGETVIDYVAGRWPDSVGAVAHQSVGVYPTFFPLTWKSPGFVLGPGGSTATISGVARIGDSLLVVGSSVLLGHQIIRVHGPKLSRKFLTEQEVGCKRDSDRAPATIFIPAVRPEVVDSTPAGTMVSVGNTCRLEYGELAAEIWSKEGKSRFVDLTPFWKKDKKHKLVKAVLKGTGDELFVFKSSLSSILRYHDGKLAALPALGSPVWHAFVSPSGKLHANSGRSIYRFDAGRWTPVARLVEPTADAAATVRPSFKSIVTDGETFFASDASSVYRLRPISAGDARCDAAAPASPTRCTAPFVYLFEVGEDTPKRYDFPKIRKALSSSSELAGAALVETKDDGTRHLGVKVASMKQGKAVLAQLEASLKDQEPKLTCYDPWSFRAISIDAGNE